MFYFSLLFCTDTVTVTSSGQPRVNAASSWLVGGKRRRSLTDILLSRAPLGGTMGSWRTRRPQTGVPDGLVWFDPPWGFALLDKVRNQTADLTGLKSKVRAVSTNQSINQYADHWIVSPWLQGLIWLRVCLAGFWSALISCKHMILVLLL